jgi:hypothetical protein
MSVAPKSRTEKLQFAKRTVDSADVGLALLEEGDCPCIDIAELLDQCIFYSTYNCNEITYHKLCYRE